MWSAPATAALVLFAGTILLVALFERYRLPLVGGGAALAVGLGLVAPGRLVPSGWAATGSVVEWNALVLLAGLLLFAALLGSLEVPRYIALRIAHGLAGSPQRIFVALAVLTFVLAMFLNALAVVVILIPVSLEVARELKINPLPFVLAEVLSANFGGTATLIGNPPNLILASQFGLTFSGFFEYAALPAVAGFVVVLGWLARRFPLSRAPGADPISPPPRLDRPHVAVAVGGFATMIVLLAEAGPLGLPLWAIGVGGALAALAIAGTRFARGMLADFDGSTLLFLLGLFVIVGALEDTGVIRSLADGIVSTGISDPLELGLLLLGGLGVLSALVDNIPLAAVAGPLIANVAAATGVSPAPLAYATVLGLGAGGNGTPIGAISNVTALASAERAGIRIGWRTYLREGIPIMLLGLAAVGAVWLLVG